MTCPCSVCDDRYLGCHSQCDAYKAWHDAHDTEVLARYAEREKSRLVTGYKREAPSRKQFLKGRRK